MKTKTKNIFFLIVLLSIQNVYGDFGGVGSSTYVDSKNAQTININKIHGENELLYVHEDYIINPFSSSTITINQLNGVTTSNSVNGSIFNPSHPLYRTAGFYTSPDWVAVTGKPGVFTRIQYLDNTYGVVSGILTPKQNVRVRKYYKVSFNYDTTPPLGGDLKLFDDESGTTPFSYTGGWVNIPKYYTMYCSDPETRCKCSSEDTQCEITPDGKVRLIPQILGNKTQPTAVFKNNVDLSGIATGRITGIDNFLYDSDAQSIGIIFSDLTKMSEAIDWKTANPGLLLPDDFLPDDFLLRKEENREYKTRADGKKYDSVDIPGKLIYEGKKQVSFKANTDKHLFLFIEDTYKSGGNTGVSGIKDYTFNVAKKRDASSIYDTVYTKSEIYGVYNSTGAIEKSDSKVVSISNYALQVLHQIGDYKITLKVSDFAGNITEVTTYFTVYPSELDENQSLLTVEEKDTFDGKVLGDNKSYYKFTGELKDRFGNPIYDKNILSLSQDISGFIGGKTNFLDMLTKTGSSGLKITNSTPLKTDKNGKFIFNVYSYVPGDFSQRFKINLYKWNNSYIDTSAQSTLYLGKNVSYSEKTFHQIFKPTISLNDEIPQLGKEQDYKITLENPSAFSFLNGILDLKISNLDFLTPHKFKDLIIPTKSFSPTKDYVAFSGSIDITDYSATLMTPEMEVKNLPVKYRVAGKDVTYLLDPLNNDFCTIGSLATLGVSVEGNIQGVGKLSTTTKRESFSDISTSDIRTSIRKNVSNLTRGRQGNGDIVQGIKYVENNNEVITGNQTYETLIVKNGNVIITGNITNTLAIIVLKDTGYNIQSDYNTRGNIYIDKSVTELNTIIYADGTLRSAKANGDIYNDSELSNSLLIKGALFTRNTIGGAVSVDSNFVLPGGEKTNNSDLAEKYDLNFTRKANLCKAPYYSLRVEYDQSIISNPPKGFNF